MAGCKADTWEPGDVKNYQVAAQQLDLVAKLPKHFET